MTARLVSSKVTSGALRTGEIGLEGAASELKANYERLAEAYLGARR